MSLADQASLLLIPTGYKSQKVYSIFPTDGDGDFDFSRSSSATRIAKNGLITTVAANVPRLEYPLIDGVVSGCPSLLLEPQRINTLSYSEDFSQSYWNSGGVTVSSNDAISPDGTQNADLITVNSGSADGGIFRFGTWNTTLQTFSLFAKKGNHNRIQLGQASNNWWAIFDLEDGYVVSQNGNLTSSEIVDYGNGWYRCIVSHDNPSGTATLSAKIIGENNSVYFWGAMLEIGSYQTSYIPNLSTGSTTRSAETANNSGDADTFNDSEGVLMAEISALSNSGGESAVTISNDTYNERLIMYTYQNYIYSFVFTSSGTMLSYGSTNYNVEEFNKISIKYKSGDYALWINGFEVSSNSNTFTPTGLATLDLDDGVSGLDFKGKTKQVQYYNSALTDSELEKISSWTSFSDMANGQLYSIE